MADETQATQPIDPGVRIGHAHLKVSDLERSLAFYCGVLGFDLMQRLPQMAFLSAGGYHHHLALNTWESRGGAPPPRGTTGLYHVAILYPSRAALGDALRRLRDAGIYLHDPDGNGLELYRDRPKEEWPRDPQGRLTMISEPVDLEDLLREGARGGGR
ncbi:MAG: glyoxalase [Candidatus Eisenbacteria bacterium]|uniref:Glyoxalase n=1 Tax=Eiseniibacteriota bacterium TaxID=2212470 RepID=A0A538TZQ5_UNCEI|nr:MAG: glyoxalase [Candidatus Eisenbacteria bacterium]